MSEFYGLILRTPAKAFFFFFNGVGYILLPGSIKQEIPKFKLAFIRGLLVVLEGLVVCELRFCAIW